MTFISSAHVSDEEKLNLLRRADRFRDWHSLDDERYCLVCSKIITGHEIQLVGGTPGNGELRLVCPTERCQSIPMDWVLPTGVLADIAMQKVQDNDRATSTPMVDEPICTRSPSFSEDEQIMCAHFSNLVRRQDDNENANRKA